MKRNFKHFLWILKMIVTPDKFKDENDRINWMWYIHIELKMWLYDLKITRFIKGIFNKDNSSSDIPF